MTQHFSHFTADDQQAAQERRQGDSPSGAGDAAPAASIMPGGLAERAQKAMRAAGRPSALSLLTASYAAAVEGRSDGGSDTFSPRSVITGASFSDPVEKKGKPKKEAPLREAADSAASRPFGDRPAPQTIAGIVDQMECDYLAFSLPASDGTMKCKVGGDDEADIVARAIRFFETNGLVFSGDGSGGPSFRRRLDFGLMDEKERPAKILVGSYTSGVPHIDIRGGGGLCAALAPAAQAEFPDGRASRVDVKLDVSVGPEGFDALYAWAGRFASCRLRPGAPELDPRGTAEGGRTFTMGARKSTVYLRVYEKGLQMCGAGHDDVDPRLVRIEFELKDFYSWEKAEIFQLSPGDALRSKGGWGRKWMEGAISALGLLAHPEKIVLRHMVTERPARTLADSADHGVRQYGKTFVRLAAHEMVEQDYGGSRAAAVLDHDTVEDKAVEAFRTRLRAAGAVAAVLTEQGLLGAECDDERARRMAEESAARGVLAAQKDASVRRRLAIVIGAESAARAKVKRKVEVGADRAEERAAAQKTASMLVRDAALLVQARQDVREGKEVLAQEAVRLGAWHRKLSDIAWHLADPSIIHFDPDLESARAAWAASRSRASSWPAAQGDQP